MDTLAPFPLSSPLLPSRKSKYDVNRLPPPHGIARPSKSSQTPRVSGLMGRYIRGRAAPTIVRWNPSGCGEHDILNLDPPGLVFKGPPAAYNIHAELLFDLLLDDLLRLGCLLKMSEHHHHHLFHHKKEDENVPTQVVYSETVSDDGCQVTQTADVVAVQAKTEEDYRREEKHHKHKEHLGELGTVAAGAFALHEKHKAEKDPENAHRHKVEEEVAAAVGVGGVGYTLHEHHQKEEAKEHRHHLL